jgi:hypothetical protein
MEMFKTKLSFLLILLVLSLFSCDSQVDPENVLVNQIAETTAYVLKDKYPGIHFNAYCVEAPQNKIKKVLVYFNFSTKVMVDEARPILIDVISEFIKQVNLNHKIQEYLYAPPFTIKNLDTAIFYQKNCAKLYHIPYLVNSGSIGNKLKYTGMGKKDEFDYQVVKRETFDEALVLLKKQSSS